MAARIRSLRNMVVPIDEASRDDLVAADVVTVQALDAATTYAWALLFVPEGSAATFSGDTSAVSPGSFTVDLPGAYLVRLTVDATLSSESEQYVRLRALTTDLSLKLVAAGERRDETGTIPVDADPEGWANDQNANFTALEAAVASALAADLQVAYDNGNLVVLTDATTPIVVRAGAAPSARLLEFQTAAGDSLGRFSHTAANQLDLIAADNAAGDGTMLSLFAGSATAGVSDGGDVRVRPGAGFGGGAEGELVLQDAAGANEVGFYVSGADTIQIRTPGGGGLPLEYNTSTGKLTVPGILDPTALLMVEAAAPTTAAGEAAIFVSDGSGGTTVGELYFRAASDGTVVPLSPGNVQVEEEGAGLGKFTTLDFVGLGVTAADAGGGKITVTIPELGLDQVAFVDPVNGSDVAGAFGGGQAFATIQAAINAVPAPVDAATELTRWVILVSPGAYDEDLTIGPARRISLLGLGPVTLGDGAVANFGSTAPRSITWTNDASAEFGAARATLLIGTLVSAETSSTHTAYAAGWHISGGLTLVNNALQTTTAELHLNHVAVTGTVDGTGHDGVINTYLYRCFFDTTLDCPTMQLGIAESTKFDGPTTIQHYSRMTDCGISGGFTVSAAPSPDFPPTGMYSCDFAGTFTGPITSLWLDGNTNYWFKANAAGLAGGATKVMLTDIVP